MWAKRDHALLFSITEFSSCQLRWDRRRSRWVAVSAINQHEIFSFEYTHHLLLLLLLALLENTPIPKKKKRRWSVCLRCFIFSDRVHVCAATHFLINWGGGFLCLFRWHHLVKLSPLLWRLEGRSKWSPRLGGNERKGGTVLGWNCIKCSATAGFSLCCSKFMQLTWQSPAWQLSPPSPPPR